MEAQFEAMQKYLVGHMPKLNTNIEGKGVSIATMKSTVDKIKKSDRNVKSRIEKHFQKLIDQIRQREAELLKELETISKSQILDFQERIQLEEINLQKYQQQLQFIQQTVKSASLIDTCNMYLSLVSDAYQGEPCFFKILIFLL
jgi:lipid II:glycine glycyltransferase (peptidoglycan interpeptide bridge formation enzyme)